MTRHGRRPDALSPRARARSPGPPEPVIRLDPPVAGHPRGRSSRRTSRRGATVSSGGPARHATGPTEPRWSPTLPDAPCQEACPAGTDAGRYVGLIAAGPLRRRLRGGRRSQPVPVGLRLDLHGTVRGRLPTRDARRADRDPHASSASPSSTATLPPVAAARRSDGRRRSRSSVADRPACRPPTTWPASATR